MKRALLAACLIAGAVGAGAMAVAAPPGSAGSAAADPPTVASLSALMENELHWGMSHTELTAAYNQQSGLFDRDYAPQLAKLPAGSQGQRELEADLENRKANLERSLTPFDPGSPTGYDVSALHLEYTYGNGESVQKLFKDGKNRYFFYIKDRFWKMYDEVPLRSDGPLGSSYQEAVTKLNALFGVAARIRAADPSKGLERTEADWQDGRSHLRAIDRSGEHLVGIVMVDKNTEMNLPSLRTYKAADPFALDPSVANITKNGVTDPNAARSMPSADAGAKGKGKH